MRIIITGGTGLMGRALCPLLLADRHLVTVLSRNPDESYNMPSGVRIEKWDGKTTDGWSHLANGADAIINLAGAGIADRPWTAARKKVIRESRIHAGLAVQKAIGEATQKPKVLIQASAVGYYGQPNLPITFYGRGTACSVVVRHVDGGPWVNVILADVQLSEDQSYWTGLVGFSGPGGALVERGSYCMQMVGTGGCIMIEVQ